ncbi:MAG: dihydrolipoamide acetyltransferase family protein [Verrucomicrobiota bacterium]|jgi:pyruvate dehydrogenase E2 component (dihydrolipoamide acetyltransferase)
MAKEIKLPHLGDNIEGGDVVGLHVAVGDTVQEGQTILELETDKAVVEVPSPTTGKIVELKVAQGEKVAVGATIALIEEGAAQTEAPAPPAKEETPQPATPPAQAEQAPEPPAGEEPSQPQAPQAKPQATAPASAATKPAPPAAAPTADAGVPLPASPSTRALARELGVNLAQVKGSGPGGRITPDDVRNHIRVLSEQAMLQAQAAEKQDAYGEVQHQNISSLRRKIGEAMSQSWSTIPMVTQFDEADITELEALRKRHSSTIKEQGGGLTITVFVVKAVVAALKEFPQFNASLESSGQSLLLKKYYNIGVAVDTEAGLIVPVLHHADRKSIKELALLLPALAKKTRERKTSLDELQGATFTISNLGGIGGTAFTPIVNPPEVAIMGVSRSQMKPIWNGSEFTARLIMPFGITYDHRVIDGADAARFARRIAELLENPDSLFLNA